MKFQLFKHITIQHPEGFRDNNATIQQCNHITIQQCSNATMK
jgi:hypothetical protein